MPAVNSSVIIVQGGSSGLIIQNTEFRGQVGKLFTNDEAASLTSLQINTKRLASIEREEVFRLYPIGYAFGNGSTQHSIMQCRRILDIYFLSRADQHFLFPIAQ